MLAMLLTSLLRASRGLGSRMRNAWYRALGVRIHGYVWMAPVEIPRLHSSVELVGPCALDRGVVLLCSGPADGSTRIRIDRNVYINRNTFIDASQSVRIGESVAIGPNCYITDHDHGMKPGKPVLEQPLVARPVTIGREAWIGANVVVTKGVTIGEGAVVGAGSVVTRDIPAGMVAAGVPARVLRARDERQGDSQP